MSAKTPLHKLNPTQWVTRYADYLYNYTIVRVNDHEVAQDIVSDTFLAGLKSKDNYKGEANERTWLVSILKRKIIDHYRKKNSQKGKAEVRMHYSDTEEQGDWLEEKAPDVNQKNVEGHIENEELGEAIQNCLDTLQEKQATLFKLKTIQGVDTETLCNDFNIFSLEVSRLL